MANVTLAAVAAVHLLTAVAFFAVGRRFQARKVESGMGLARDAFVAWWWAFGAYLAGQGALDLAAASGQTSFGAFVAFRLASGPLLAFAAAGLAYHILFLWSGKRWWALPLAFYYGAAGAVYSCWVWFHEPLGVAVGPWGADVAYAQPIAGPVWMAVLASIGLPLVLGSAAFLALAAKVHDRAKRYRIVLVGSSLLLWVVSGYSAQVGGGAILQFVAIVVL
ncbi:MAG: hypothetical protein QOC71_1858, partial [Thermoplasmata archaeon]|nr:hypothetical protein [Thermoplasmata archaeon]